MRTVLGALTILAISAACSAPAPQPAANTAATDAAAHQAHEAYVTAINSNNHRDADGKWRVARDAWGPDHPAR